MKPVKHFYQSKISWLIEHILFMGIPFMVFLSQPQNIPLQYFALSVSVVYMIGIAFIVGTTPQEIGFTTKYFKEAFRYIFLPTVAIGICIILLKFVLPQAFILSSNNFLLIFQYVLISVPLQEILFRGFCLWRCSLSYRNIWFIILFNSSYFAMFHIIFKNDWFVLGVFLVNIYWTYAFLKYRNLYTFMISHAILGTLYFLPIK